MSASANENGHNETGFSWRVRQSTDQDVTAFNGPIVFELTDTHGSTLSTFTILPEKLNELLRPHLSIFAELQLDGTVSLDSEICVSTSTPLTETDILQLALQAVAPEMLEDEPEAAQMLSKFRGRLLKSLEHVEQAIASLPKD
jgi:hypothetical protein